MATNISVRVPWHDASWDGSVCRNPAANCHCIDYENILRQKSISQEEPDAGKHWSSLKILPPCSAESGGFLSAKPWTITRVHPYRGNTKTQATHGHLLPTSWSVEPFTAHPIPFGWMRRGEVDEHVQPKISSPLPPDDEFPNGFKSTWVFSSALQGAILEGFWRHVVEHDSLAFFYTKKAHPVADDIPRLVVGIGEVAAVGQQRFHNVADQSKRSYPMWERDCAHTLRPGGQGGVLVPFHSYLAPTGDENEDARRRDLARRLVIAPEPDRIPEFSYRSEHVSPDTTVSILTQALRVVGFLREDGIADGDWEAAETWINQRLARAWLLRGPHPGLGPVLEAMGLRLGTSLVYVLAASNSRFSENPWSAIGPVLEGEVAPPDKRYQTDLEAFRPIWRHLTAQPGRMALAEVLSSFALDSDEAKRWWDPDLRQKATFAFADDENIVNNPYLVSELDKGSDSSRPVSFATVDRGVLMSGKEPPVSPSDRRRRRAAAVWVLRRAAAEGDTLLAVSEIKDLVSKVPVPEAVGLPEGWLEAEADFIRERLRVSQTPVAHAQLADRAIISEMLKRKLEARVLREIPIPEESWRELLIETVRSVSEDKASFDLNDDRIALALDEQVEALKTILSRKLTVLVGRAGTGKTTVLGALSRAGQMNGKVLLLAPTGKARVRLESRVLPGTDVRTVAGYLHALKRYDGFRQQPVIGEPTYDAHETVVIDESSMLTEDDLAAVVASFTPAVKRLILVGDPAQLPPIGPGRPFADLVGYLDPSATADDEDLDNLNRRRGALARLTHEVRSVRGRRSDTLRLAGWFTDQAASPDGERIFAELSDSKAGLNDLDVRFWEGPQDLHKSIKHVLKEVLDIEEDDLASFNKSFRMAPFKSGWYPADPAGAETWQILSPVRRDVWGCDDLNKWVQSTWRHKALANAREYHAAFGPQEIVKHDKVILVRNGVREGYDSVTKQRFEQFLANGEVALAKTEGSVPTKVGKKSILNLLFAGRPASQTFGFWKNEFGGNESGPGIVELAYALTVHKAQGSEFGVVIVVLPKGRMAFRELIYTALTRSRTRLVLLVQGSNVADLILLSKPSASDTIRRNSNLFRVAVRESDERPFARHLVHLAPDGELLRSKSELVIYSRCLDAGLKPLYERRLDAPDGSWKWPDFTFSDAADDPIVWEHLGMLDDRYYAEEWSRKREWYSTHGFNENDNLYISEERGGLRVADVDAVIAKILDRIR